MRRQEAQQRLECFVPYTLDLEPAKHHRKFCEALDRVTRGKCRRLIISAPPGSAKSTYTNLAFPAHFMGNNPGKNVISGSHTADFSETWGRKVRNLIETKEYHDIFETTEMSPDSRAAGAWSLSTKGEYFAVGVGGSVTGRRADLLVIDDPFRGRQDADSALRRDLVWNWYRADAYTRLKPKGAIVIIATRWHEDDLIGRLLAADSDTRTDRWEYLSFPALCRDPESDILNRKEGEALWPDWQNEEELLQIKEDIGDREFRCLYQQDPIPGEGNVVQRSWFQLYRKAPEGLKIVQSWDTGNTAKERSAPSVCITAGISPGKDVYILDVWRKAVEFTELFARAQELKRRYNPRAILIESRGNGTSLIQSGKYANYGPIIEINPQNVGDKEFRFDLCTPMIQSGKVFLPEKSSWVEDFLYELLAFPDGKYRDQVDACSQLLNWVHGKNSRRKVLKLRGL